MNITPAAFSWKKQTNLIEWKLLLFLVMVMDVKLIVKLLALVLAFLLQPSLSFRFHTKQTRLPWFYPAMAAILVINYFLYADFSIPYLLVAITALFFWAASLAAMHHLKTWVENTGIEKLQHTLRLFFVLNLLCSALQLFAIAAEIGWRNPFLYQGQYQKYFMNTGDYIKGITLDTSTTNAVICCFGLVYFLIRRNYLLTVASMIILLFTASNISNMILLLVLAGIFIGYSTREQKSIIMVCGILLVLFFAKCSPQNESYALDTLKKFILHTPRPQASVASSIPIRERPDSQLTPDEREEKIATLYLDSLSKGAAPRQPVNEDNPISSLSLKPAIPTDSIHTASFQWKRDTSIFQQQLLLYVQRAGGSISNYQNNQPGKWQAMKESVLFLKDHPGKLFSGDGAGNFSSKLAFRATGLQMAGGFPQAFARSSPEFSQHHLSLYAWFFSKHADAHSVIHNPASVYDQLLTEYGIIGLLALPLLYGSFFIRQWKKLSYGRPLIVMLFAFFAVDYWFEQLSIVLLFELMAFIDIKENSQPAAYA